MLLYHRKILKIGWDTEKSEIDHLEVLETLSSKVYHQILYYYLRFSKGLWIVYSFLYYLQSSNTKLNHATTSHWLLPIILSYSASDPFFDLQKDIPPLYIPFCMPKKAWFTSHCRKFDPKPQNGCIISIPQIHLIFPLMSISFNADFQWESIIVYFRKVCTASKQTKKMHTVMKLRYLAENSTKWQKEDRSWMLKLVGINLKLTECK